MPEPSMFDLMRITGDQALTYSKEWFKEPTHTAHKFTHFMVHHGAYGRLDDQMTLASQGDYAGNNLAQSFFCTALLAGMWAMSGYPTVTMGHKTAAAFMATKIRPEDAVEFVRIPWPAFAIRIPSGMLLIEEDGILRDASLLLVTALEPAVVHLPIIRHTMYTDSPSSRWWYRIIADSPTQRPPWINPEMKGFFEGMTLWGFNTPLELMAVPDGGATVEGYTRWDTHVAVDLDKRTEQMARALIIGACLHLAGDPRERAERNAQDGIKVTERKSKFREGDALPQYTQFEVTSSIRLNLHHAVREYVERGSSSPTVQTMVAGHWKRVAYGVGRSNRRLQHIHPYWRGDINAPISVRVK